MSEQQRAVNARISAHVPSDAWLSTVALIGARRPRAGQIGSGTLFQIADRHFLVTARHVMGAAHQHGVTVAIGDIGTNLIALSGDSMCSAPRDGSHADPYDIAVHPLPAETVARLTAKRFLRIGDVSFADPGPKAVFTVFGYPGIWSAASLSDGDELSVKPLEFTTYAYDGSVSSFPDYQERLHLLLAADDEHLTDPGGEPVEFRDRFGQVARLPIGLKGISGCGVWHVGDLAIPIEKWIERPPRLVAVETGAYQHSGVIRASRWAIVTTLIHKAFPELRRSIELWLP